MFLIGLIVGCWVEMVVLGLIVIATDTKKKNGRRKKVAEQIELKPCPFCGGEAKLHACGEFENDALRILYAGSVGVHCTQCRVATIPYKSIREATKAWNRRAKRKWLM